METLNKFRTFLQESWLEVRHKVTWPSSREVWGTTWVVLVTTLAFAAFLFVVDHVTFMLVDKALAKLG